MGVEKAVAEMEAVAARQVWVWEGSSKGTDVASM